MRSRARRALASVAAALLAILLAGPATAQVAPTAPVAGARPGTGPFAAPAPRAGNGRSWVAYYRDEAPPAAFSPFDIVVLDADRHPPLGPLLLMRKLLLGYLSLGEVENYRPHFKAVQGDRILLRENKNWPGAYFIDVRDPRWTRRVVDQLVPSILDQGFAGVFLDTLDNPPELERQDPRRYAGMTEASKRLVLAIREKFPGIKIMLNRAYEILPDVGGAVDMALGESVYASYNFATKRYQRVSEADYKLQLGWLQQARQRFPTLQVMTLDYWNPDDAKGIAEIYRIQRANGFEPYVATVGLDRVMPRPE